MKVDAIAKMMEGNARFRGGVSGDAFAFCSLAEMQKPDVLFIAWADSRTVPSLIFQTEPGELFICRIVGMWCRCSAMRTGARRRPSNMR